MNEAGMLHIPDSRYCFAVGTKELVIRIRLAKEDKDTKVFLLYGKKYDYHLKRQRKELFVGYEDQTFVYFEAKLMLEDTRLAYIFCLEDKTGTFYFSEDGLTKEYDFENGFYNFFQMPYINQVDVLPSLPWMREAVFYQIFVDRFAQGDFNKDQSYITMQWGDTPTPKNFAGGDLLGILKNLDYLSDLGVTALYLTPIFKSPSNHKYDIVDYYEIDQQFGSKEQLKLLIETAHQKGMRVVLDAVFNHCSMLSKEFTDVLRKGRKSKYHDWFLIDGDFPDVKVVNYECFASCYYMPKWNTSNPMVQEHLTQIGLYWIREFDIDGWRLDVSDEVSHQFWRKFRIAVKNEKEDCVLIGENWHDAYPYLMGDQYDSIMNYAFTKACLDCFATGKLSAQGMSGRLNHILMRNMEQVNQMNLNLLDSHDTHRIFTQIGASKEKLLAALSLMFIFPGVPCLYYGTEICMEGGYDPDSRRTFDWNKDNWDKDILEKMKSLIQLKKDKRIQDGEVKIYSKSGLLVIERKLNKDKLVFYLNLSNQPQVFQLEGNVIIENQLENHQILLPYGFTLFEIEEKCDEIQND